MGNDIIDMERGTQFEFPNKLERNGHFEVLDLEINQSCNNCTVSHVCSTTGNHIPLYKYNEIPPYLRGNPYVINGYRSMLPFNVCLKSLFVMTNETVNIWSHLLGYVIFFLLMLWDIAVFIPDSSGSLSDYFIISLGLLCFQFCMLCSTGYHLFLCHSERASRRWLSLDLTGISIGLLGCYLPAVHYAFYCLSIWRDIYMVVISVLFAAVFVCQTNPHYFSEEWFRRRLLLYVALCAYGVVPSLHWIYLNGGLHADIVQMFLPRVAVMYLLGVAAFTFYISKFPERCSPGHWDYIGSSHQFWHVIVVAAFYWWHQSGRELMLYRLQHPCV